MANSLPITPVEISDPVQVIRRLRSGGSLPGIGHMRHAVQHPQPVALQSQVISCWPALGPVPGDAHSRAAHPECPSSGADRPAVLQEIPDGLHLLR